MKLTYYGHSAFQLKTATETLLFDPFITGNPLAEGVVTAEELHPSVILLTHAHGDHWGDTAVLAQRTGALVIANYEITQYLIRVHGYTNVHPMNAGGSWDFPWGRVRQTYARHSSSFPDGTYGGNPNGYLLHLDGRTIYNMGDTCAFAEMAWIGEEHAIDLALIPIGDDFTMGPNEAVRAARMVRPKRSVPIHYNTFPLIRVDAAAWVQMMAAAGMEAQVLKAGETMEL